MAAQLNIFNEDQLLDYTSMTEWELAARHMVARLRKNYELCREIEQVVAEKGKNVNLLKKLPYYQPVGSQK
jgi:hypothetical protein